MPVYFRKTARSITPPSFSEFPSDDDDYHIDPDKHWDLLPQPFRTVDKIVTKLFDQVWTIAAEREALKKAEEARNLAPPVDNPDTIRELEGVTALCSTNDGRYIFVGLRNGLAAIDTASMMVIDRWEDKKKEVVSIQTVEFAPDLYLIAEVDDMGIGRLLAFWTERLYLVKVMNELEGHSKLIALNVQLSPDGNFCALGLQITNDSGSEPCEDEDLAKETWVEVHKLPRETWLREIDQAASSKQSTNRSKVSNESLNRSGEGHGSESSHRSTTDNENQDRIGHKFSPPSLVLKCKPPPNMTASSAPTFTALMKSIDTSGDVIGLGANHIINQSHLDQRNLVFKRMHEQMLHYLPNEKDKPKNILYPTLHFLTNGRTPPLLLDLQNNQSTSIALWWSGDHRVYLYSLLKPSAKDVEHKPDILWTFDSSISCSTISPCNSFLGFGLHSGNVILTDKENGITRRVSQLSSKPITRLDLLPPLPQSSNENKAALPRAIGVDRECNYFLMQDNKPPMKMQTSDKHQPELPQWVEHINGHPDLVYRVSGHGRITIHDVTNSKEVCRLQLPEPFAVALPWKPIITIGNQGSTLCVKGSSEKENPDSDAPEVKDFIFHFSLRNIESLHTYWVRQHRDKPFFIRKSTESRIQAIMEARFSTHNQRQAGLKSRWSKLDDTLKILEDKKRSVVNASTNIVSFG